MTFLTDFADQAVILPLVLAVAIALAAQGWWRGALSWLAVVGATFTAMLALKLTFLACSPLFGPVHVRSPSGHVAAATVVVGGLAAMLTGRRLSLLPAACLAASVIGLSRIFLGAHSLPEVVIGAGVGLAGAMLLQRLAGPPPALRRIPVIAVVIIVAAVFHGTRLPAEAAIRRTAWKLSLYVDACRLPAHTARVGMTGGAAAQIPVALAP